MRQYVECAGGHAWNVDDVEAECKEKFSEVIQQVAGRLQYALDDASSAFDGNVPDEILKNWFSEQFLKEIEEL